MFEYCEQCVREHIPGEHILENSSDTDSQEDPLLPDHQKWPWTDSKQFEEENEMGRHRMDDKDNKHQSETPEGVHDILSRQNNPLATGDAFRIIARGEDKDYEGDHHQGDSN